MRVTPPFVRHRIAHRPNLLRIVDNMSWLTLDKIFRMGASLVIGIWLARHLGPEMFGALSFALAIAGILAGVGSLGLQSIVVRDSARRPERAPRIIATSVVMQATAGLIIYIATIFLVLTIGPEDNLLRLLIVIVSAQMLLQFRSVLSYWFESQVQSRYTVAANSIAFGIASVLKIALIISDSPVAWFAAVAVGEAALAAAFLTAAFLKFGLGYQGMRVDLRMASYLLRQSWPLIISAVAVGLAMRIDQVMLGIALETREVGYYAVAVRIAEILVIPGAILASSVFPRLLSLDTERLNYEFVRLVRYPFYIILFAATILALGAYPLVSSAFGADFTPAAPALALLSFSIPFTYISIMSTNYLLRIKDQKEIFFRQLSGLMLNIGLNILLIPRFGIVGAAVATVLTDTLISVGMDLGRRRYRPLLALKIEALTGLRLRIS